MACGAQLPGERHRRGLCCPSVCVRKKKSLVGVIRHRHMPAWPGNQAGKGVQARSPSAPRGAGTSSFSRVAVPLLPASINTVGDWALGRRGALSRRRTAPCGLRNDGETTSRPSRAAFIPIVLGRPFCTICITTGNKMEVCP